MQSTEMPHIADALQALAGIVATISHPEYALAVGQHMTCSEADHLARLVLRLGEVEAAARIIYGHSVGDDDIDDDHQDMDEGDAVQYVLRLA